MTILTTGIRANNAPLVARQELRTFLKDVDLMNLYLLALKRMQDTNQNDLQSWFQVAGIHGRPYIPYDGSGNPGEFGGYCTHSSILFLPWHRPYLALYEQILGKHVQDIASSYTNQADLTKYTRAAARFRVPYWDWALTADVADVVSRQQTVQVNTPDRGVITINNPLFSYTFHPLNADFGDGLPDERAWETMRSTLRWPTRRDALGVSQPVPMEQLLLNNRLTIRDRTYNLLTQTTSYPTFSNHTSSGAGFRDNLESIHDSLHGFTGRSGHMSSPDFAAFDPLFWLHHANVDRIFAIWQVLNPNSYVVPRVTDFGTFTTPPGSTEDDRTDLTPFWRAQGIYWKARDVRDTRTFNYTYPELVGFSSPPTSQQIQGLRLKINSTYGATAPIANVDPGLFRGASASSANIATSTAAAEVESHGEAPAQRVAAVAHAPSTSGQVNLPKAPTHDIPKEYYEWVVKIVVEKYTLETGFWVHIFLGDFDSNPENWGTEPNLVGTHVIFATDLGSTGCERCRQAANANKLVTGTLPLTGALGDRLGVEKLKDLKPEEIVPYLQRNLHWRIQKPDGETVERSEIASLKISVAYSVVSLPQSIEEFPVWGEMSKELAVTTGRPGGADE